MVTFEEWMSQVGLSKSTILKYQGAISGALSDWAKEARLISGSLLDIVDKSQFSALTIQIELLPVFQERNSTGHNMYSAALRCYSRYLDQMGGNTKRQSISEAQVIAACEIARQVFDGKVMVTEGVDVLVSEHGLNQATARDFINDYKLLLKGQVFHRAMSASAMRYFLGQISATHGRSGLANAVTALRAHIDYFEGHYKTTMHALRTVADDFEPLAQRPSTAADLEMEFSVAVKRSLSSPRTDRLQRLAKAVKKPNIVKVETSVFVRNPDVVAEVLLRAKGKCEGCDADAPFLRAKDGTPYLEVHHRIPLADSGEDSVENAVALCPNCHRRMHYGPAEQ